MNHAEVYANLLIQGKKTMEEVPEELVEEVTTILKSRGYPPDFFNF